jgi:hypothetical protein
MNHYAKPDCRCMNCLVIAVLQALGLEAQVTETGVLVAGELEVWEAGNALGLAVAGVLAPVSDDLFDFWVNAVKEHRRQIQASAKFTQMETAGNA